MIKLDERDLKLLSVLQAEGRITKNDLAKRINLSSTACWERLKRLETHGVIEGYGARVSASVFGPRTTIIMQAELDSHRSPDFIRFEKTIEQISEIVECWAVGGGVDYFLKFVCRDIDSYQRLVDRMLDRNIGLKRYYTFIVTKTVKSTASPLASLEPGQHSN
ncbi:MAG: Lrp/AsnC family transcriptional regulator [Alphaproteobacteria bacterium]|nr:Lrp/AsnC family transcriptional regulator [Alphaproteobacteria bacterium]